MSISDTFQNSRMEHDTVMNEKPAEPELRHVALRGHTDAVWGVAVHPKDGTIVTGSGDKTVMLWTPEGDLVETLTGHTASVWAVAVHHTVAAHPANGRYITASGDRTVGVWGKAGYGDVKSRRSLLNLQPVKSRRGSEKPTPTQSRRGSEKPTPSEHSEMPGRGHLGFAPGSAQVDPHKIVLLLSCRGHMSHVFAVVVDPTTGNIVTGSGDKTAMVFDPTTGKRLITLSPHSGAVMAVAVDPNSGNVITGSGYFFVLNPMCDQSTAITAL